MSARLFGKMPAHGDFVARGWSPDAREAVDRWLSASLDAAVARWGTAFAERFDAALPWRGEGDGVVAAIAPSQDAVGRRFPLAIVAAGDDAAALEALLYAAIVERWDADRLAARAARPHGDVARWCGEGDARDGMCPPDLIEAMLA